MEELKLPDGLLQFCDIPFKNVPHSLRVWLGLHLNPERNSIAPRTDVLQDWRGVAEVLEFSPLEIQNFQRSPDPMGEVLKNMKIAREDPTVGEILWAILQCERYDILENKKLVEFLQKVNPTKVQLKIEKELQDPNIDSCSEEQDSCLTVGEADTGIKEYFNAFVCYNPVDLPFVKNMRIELEEKQNFKLFIPERDFLAGPAKYQAITKLIKERCDKFIVVISPDFMNSEECAFMLNFAHSLHPNAIKKKIIPILYKRCEIPSILAFITLVDYTRGDVIDWFWNRLSKSLKAPTFLSASAYPTSKHLDQMDTRSPFQENVSVKLKTKKTHDYEEIEYRMSPNNSDQACGEARGSSPIEDFINVSTEMLPVNSVPQNKSFSFTQKFKF